MTPALETALPIAVPYADVRGDALRWALGLPARTALASRTIALADGRTVDLRVLGASHQVLVRRGSDVVLSETVACDLTGADSLPGHTATAGYRLDAGIERLGPVDFATRVDGLVDLLAPEPSAVVAAFPGSPHAVTAIALSIGPASLSWQTWHAYPQSGEIVHTTTHLDASEDAHG